MVTGSEPAVIVGNEGIAEAWRGALEQVLVSAEVLTGREAEQALIAGLKSIRLRATALDETLDLIH